MKRLASLILPMFLFPVLCLAADPASDDFKDLDRIRARLSNNTIVHADFTQTKTLEALNRPVHSSGRLVVSQDQGVLWQVGSPYQVTFVVKRDAFLEVHGGGTVKDRGSGGVRSHSHISRLFEALFSVNAQELRKHFRIKVLEGERGWQLELVPLENMAKYLKFVVIMGTDFVDDVSIEEPMGDTIKVRFSNQSGNNPLTADEKRLFTLE